MVLYVIKFGAIISFQLPLLSLLLAENTFQSSLEVNSVFQAIYNGHLLAPESLFTVDFTPNRWRLQKKKSTKGKGTSCIFCNFTQSSKEAAPPPVHLYSYLRWCSINSSFQIHYLPVFSACWLFENFVFNEWENELQLWRNMHCEILFSLHLNKNRQVSCSMSHFVNKVGKELRKLRVLETVHTLCVYSYLSKQLPQELFVICKLYLLKWIDLRCYYIMENFLWISRIRGGVLILYCHSLGLSSWFPFTLPVKTRAWGVR